MSRVMIAGIAGVLLVIAMSALVVRSGSGCQENNLGSDTLLISNQEFEAKIAHDVKTRQQGLSGKTCLGDNQAMLFLFENSDVHCFWMKDMKFAIDILWFDESRRLVHQEQNVSPDSYPKNYCPPSAAKYVVEANAGTSSHYGWQLKDKLTLQNH
jgi:uncharacterized protein